MKKYPDSSFSYSKAIKGDVEVSWGGKTFTGKNMVIRGEERYVSTLPRGDGVISVEGDPDRKASAIGLHRPCR